MSVFSRYTRNFACFILSVRSEKKIEKESNLFIIIAEPVIGSVTTSKKIKLQAELWHQSVVNQSHQCLPR